MPLKTTLTSMKMITFSKVISFVSHLILKPSQKVVNNLKIKNGINK